MMKKALILYFTGTYHTKALVDSLCKELELCGVRTESFSAVKQKDPIILSGYDLIVFSYPIHAFETPEPFLEYLKKLTFPTECHYYVIKQSGEPFSLNDASSRRIDKILKKHDAKLAGEFHFLYPYNILFPYPEEWKKRLAGYDEKLLPKAVETLIKEEEHLLSYGFFTKLFSTFVSHLERFGAWINGPLFHAKKKRCTKCGLCIRSCPTKNIKEKDGYPEFSRHCCLCMRCAYHCPKDAIRIGLLNPIRVNQSTPPKDSFLTQQFFHAYNKKLKKLEKELNHPS